MKTLKLNKDSWHYKLAMQYDRHVPDNTDICSYTRLLFAAMSLMAFAITILTLLAGTILFTIGGWFAYLFGFPLHGAVVPFTFIYGGATIVIGIVAAKAHYDEHKYDKPKKEPGFVRTAYRSWKDKFCVKVEFE